MPFVPFQPTFVTQMSDKTSWHYFCVFNSFRSVLCQASFPRRATSGGNRGGSPTLCSRTWVWVEEFWSPRFWRKFRYVQFRVKGFGMLDPRTLEKIYKCLGSRTWVWDEVYLSPRFWRKFRFVWVRMWNDLVCWSQGDQRKFVDFRAHGSGYGPNVFWSPRFWMKFRYVWVHMWLFMLGTHGPEIPGNICLGEGNPGKTCRQCAQGSWNVRGTLKIWSPRFWRGTLREYTLLSLAC